MSAVLDRFAAAGRVADAVLYEGYVLYPYRASARKNQLRWQFGVLAPPRFAAANAGERATMRTEVLVAADREALLFVRVRCLHVRRRSVESAESAESGDTTFTPVASLRHRGVDIGAWDEAEECTIGLAPLPISSIAARRHEHEFVLAATRSVELLEDEDGTVGRITRRQEEVRGTVRVWAEECGGYTKVTVEVANVTDAANVALDRERALGRSTIGTHTLLGVENGHFVSLLDPDPGAADAVAQCNSDGTFPVLIGDPEARDVVLSAPIILYDFPEIAPESAGDFCDATEIDEILALRVLTLTDEEKAEARGTDARAASIVDRCEQMPAEMWSRLHGAVRSLRPAPLPFGHDDVPSISDQFDGFDEVADARFDPLSASLTIGGVLVGSGTQVRLRPSRRADAHDLFYAGRLATVKGVFSDLDGDRHVAVTLDDDPAPDLRDWQGRFLFFHPDEIEVIR